MRPCKTAACCCRCALAPARFLCNMFGCVACAHVSTCTIRLRCMRTCLHVYRPAGFSLWVRLNTAARMRSDPAQSP
eukprot:81828-Chlamydomonas_euryale.AAC.1